MFSFVSLNLILYAKFELMLNIMYSLILDSIQHLTKNLDYGSIAANFEWIDITDNREEQKFSGYSNSFTRNYFFCTVKFLKDYFKNKKTRKQRQRWSHMQLYTSK